MGKIYDVNFKTGKLTFTWEYMEDIKREELEVLRQELRACYKTINMIIENPIIKQNAAEMLIHVETVVQEELWKCLLDKYRSLSDK